MNRKQQRKMWRYFFVNGKVHKLIAADYARDEALAWCYDERATKIYQWSDIRRRASRGFTIGQVSKIIRRTTRQLHYYIEWGLIDPVRVESESGKFSMRIFSEEELFKLQDIVAHQHTGRPRKDGFITSRNAPSRQEVYAAVKHDMVLYTRTEDGRFVPLYQAED
jgi:hypothetical protein